MSTLGTIAVHFAALSLLAIGGVNVVLPEMHRLAVDVHHWTTSAQFSDLFALAQAAPGPNMLIATLIGWRAAGPSGALVASAAMCGPSCVLTYFVARVWQRFRGASWRRAVETGLGPISVGLLLAAGYLLTRGEHVRWIAYAITGGTAVLVALTRLNPLWFFAVGAVLGLARLV